MRCIIVDDEPLAREGIQMLVSRMPELKLIDSFSSADAASVFLADNVVDLVFLDIQMPGITGIEFAKQIPPKTLVIFTTAYAEYALDSYEVDAIDYLIKPVKFDRFQKAVAKAGAYLQLLNSPKTDSFDKVEDHFFVKADRRVFKIYFKDILFIEGLKDYVILHTDDQKIITAMNIKTIFAQLPTTIFTRISKSYIVNTTRIQSFDNSAVFLGKHEIPIGNAYRTQFFEEFVAKRMLSR